MKRVEMMKSVMTMAVMGMLAATSIAGTFKDKALLYLPMEEGKIMVKPANAELKILGDSKPVFAKGRKGQALAIDSEGVSIKGLKIVGGNLINGEQGTVAFWMKPLVNYTEGKGRHYFFAARKHDGFLTYIMSPKGGFFFQSVNKGKWVSPHFNFSWWKKPQWSTETWYHIAVTWGPGKETIFYVNGGKVFSKKATNSFPVKLGSVFVGCSDGGREQADALMDEFYLFNSILSKEDVVSLMNDKK